MLCDGCGSYGECDFENAIAINDIAKIAGCKCQTGYSGIPPKIKIFYAIDHIFNKYNCFIIIPIFKQGKGVTLTQMAAHKTLVHLVETVRTSHPRKRSFLVEDITAPFVPLDIRMLKINVKV